MKNVVHTSTMPFVVHCLQPINTTLEEVSLQRVTNLCTKTPVLVIAHTSGKVKARCCVPKVKYSFVKRLFSSRILNSSLKNRIVFPQEMVTNSFNAEFWMNIILPIFRGQAVAPKDEDPSLVCHMKVTRVRTKNLPLLVDKAINEATKFASVNVNKSKHENNWVRKFQ